MVRISLQQLENAGIMGAVVATDANGDLRFIDPIAPGYILRSYDTGGGQIGVQWTNPDFAIGQIYVVPNWATALALVATWDEDQTGDVVKVLADEQFTPPVLQVYIWDGTTLIDISTTPTSLAQLSDVDVTTTPPTNGQALVYSSGLSKWIPGTVSVTNKFTQGGDSFGAIARLGTNDNFNLEFETNNTLRGAIDTSGQFAWNITPGMMNGAFVIKQVAAYGNNILVLVDSSNNNSHLFTNTGYTFINAGTLLAPNGYAAIQSGATINMNAPAAAGYNFCLPNNSGQAGLASNRGIIAINHQGGTYGASLPRDMVIFYDATQPAVVGAISQKGTDTFKGIRRSIVTKTSAYTVTINDFTLLGNSTSATFDFTLPTAAAAYDTVIGAGNIFNFFKSDASANAINIKNSGGTILDTMSTQGDKFSYQSDGTNWIRIYN